MDDIDSLKRQIKELESHLEEQQKSHQAELSKIKTENYEALEASQTRYQAELEIQRTNFQKQVDELKAKLEARAGMAVTTGSDASQGALRCYGDIKRIAVMPPYMPVGDEEVRKVFTETGCEVLAIEGFKCESPTAIAHVTGEQMRDAVIRLNDPQVEAILQVGTNLAFADLAPMAEFWLDKPVLAINTATYWHALRMNGIDDRIAGFGSLLEDY